ncbi:ABC transporter ATP-binding protein YtrB [Planctomycetes bacterium Pan216]|uniref:ABC transporter ATP-binding protein YtrB n=1 Tax=Kolteria novifilia TaxID=2527975 RepID=A0A518B1V5_9BACT|nr:ABC transporter ATP-binding protein YtrB [Planctomycetes bacterium Pan216]
MTLAIRTESLTKYYGSTKVVDSLGLSIDEGTVYALLGRNGAGKSTTIKMLTGMVRPSYGRAELLGEDVATLAPETRSRIAYLAEGHPLPSWMSVGEVIRFTRAFYEDWDHDLVESVLDHFALSKRAKLRRLSKGQLAQVSLILGIAPDPELLILDDPTLGLDTNVRRDFLESMIQIIQRRGRTILFSSHVLGDVERVADRIGIMLDGVLRVDCPTEHFKEAVRKIVLTFDRDVPEVPECPGLVGSWHVGHRLELIFAGYGSEQEAAVASLDPVEVERVEMNLEDTFIEYTRGPRRSLSFFGTEEPDDPRPGAQGAA